MGNSYCNAILDTIGGATKEGLVVLGDLILKIRTPIEHDAIALALAWNLRREDWESIRNGPAVMQHLVAEQQRWQMLIQQRGLVHFDHPYKRIMVPHEDLKIE